MGPVARLNCSPPACAAARPTSASGPRSCRTVGASARPAPWAMTAIASSGIRHRPRRTACRWKMRAPEEKAADFGRVADADAAEHSIGHRHRDPAAAAAIRLAACRRAAGHAGGAADEAPSQTGDDEVTDMTIVTSNHSAPPSPRSIGIGGALTLATLAFNANSVASVLVRVVQNRGHQLRYEPRAMPGVGERHRRILQRGSGWQIGGQGAARGATAEGRKANKRTGAESSGKAAPG